MRIVIRAAIAALLILPAHAQDRPPQGIGFAQAEEGTWLCRHEDPFEALSCARELCAEQALGQDCVATAWCFPARWSGLMTVWLADFRATQVLCGVVSEAALTDALKALCAADMNAQSCDMTRSIDPDGNERVVEGASFAGGAAPAIPPADAEDQAGPPLPDDSMQPDASETP